MGNKCYHKDMEELIKYYNKFNEDKRLVSRHGQVEFAVTNKYIEEIIAGRKELSIIDIGAGTGRYTAYLESLGHNVTAVELVNKNVSQIKMKTKTAVVKQGNALELKFNDNTFDVALLFGPVYHLFSFEDKLKAITEAKRVVKKGGHILISYLTNEYAVITYAFKEGNLQNVLKEGKLTKDFVVKNTPEDLFSYDRLENINELKDKAGLKRYKIMGVDGATDYMRKELNKLSDDDFKMFIKYQMSICERPELLGASSHVLDILVK